MLYIVGKTYHFSIFKTGVHTGGRLGRSPLYNLRKQLYSPWFMQFGKEHYDIRPFCRLLFCRSSVVK